jgi:hypothetical protein
VVQSLYYAVPEKAQEENRASLDYIVRDYNYQYGASLHTYFLLTKLTKLHMKKIQNMSGEVGGRDRHITGGAEGGTDC